MNDEEIRKMAEKIKKETEIMSTPIDFEQLEKDGLIKKVGKSYYADNIHNLPEHVSKKIKSIETTKNGTKLSFYK